MLYRTRKADRRGVILLVILGLVAVFGMVAVTFILITGHHRRAALTQAQIHELYDPAPKLLEEAMYQVIRGTANPASVLRHHSLLEDTYGGSEQIMMTHFPPFGIRVDTIAPPPGSTTWNPPPPATNPPPGQLLAFTAIANFDISSGTATPVDRPYRFVGRVITAIEGPIAGRSSRIVDYDPATNMFIAVPFEEVANHELVNWFWEPFRAPPPPVPRVIRLIVNGVPFAGTGVGFNPGAFRCDAPYPDTANLFAPLTGWTFPAALLPNPKYWFSDTDPAAPGGANEDYDAVDYQNMLLALQLPQPSGAPFGLVPIPSLHRPELINYWVHRLVYDWPGSQDSDRPDLWRMVLRPDLYASPANRRAIVSLMARAMLRPLGILHPGFASTNPTWQAWANQDLSNLTEQQLAEYWASSPVLNGPWDVDNDGDGWPDSIWVDLGFPARPLPDGRYYKPLFAIHCVDLDGRLNLNAHGQLAHTEPAYYDPPDLATQSFLDPNQSSSRRLIPAGGPVDLAAYYRDGGRGLGYGPAEINLVALFQRPPTDLPDFARLRGLMSGRPLDIGGLEGRYGDLAVLLTPGLPMPGATGVDDPRSFNKLFNFPSFFANWSQPHGFGTPFDLRGYLATVLDIAGQPVWLAAGGSWVDWQVDDPYELNLNWQKGRGAPPPFQDNAFSPAELERLLRPFDVDALSLPDRLAMLLGYPSSGVPSFVFLRQMVQSFIYPHRHEITTDSWDVPVPPGPYLPGSNPASNHPVEVVAARLRAGGCPEADIPAQLRLMLGPELVAGLKLNLARVLGNRLDDNGDGVVDNISGEGDTEVMPYAIPGGTVSVPLDHDNNGQPGAVEDPRVQLARALYVLAMALTEGTNVPNDYWERLGGPRTDRARYLAQWAVNVVDFFDRDSIMTRFPYDPNPFDADGWSVPPPATQANMEWEAVVWGCERPELLITETLAFHDRRTEDLPDFGWAYPSGGQPKETEQGDEVQDLDQRYRPQGSLFVELYNPWVNHSGSSQLEPLPGEFYTIDPQTKLPAVNLSKTAPDGSPVWRLAITPVPPGPNGDSQWNAWGPEPADPDDPSANRRPALERVVYFTPTPGPADGAEVIFYSSLPNQALVLPGGYAVIGPGGPPDGGRTYIGFQTGDQQNPSTTRHIVCDPQRSPQVDVLHNETTPPPGILPPTAVMIDRAVNPGGQPRNQRLSVTEPVTGYPDTINRPDGITATYDPSTGQYDYVIDKPLDAEINPELWNQVLGKNITVTRFRMVHLQRLADPTRPYHPQLNPYLTIDSLPVDLTSFNGLSTENDFGVDDRAGEPLPPEAIMFHTRQRGEANDRPNPAGASPPDWNVWKQEPVTKLVEDDSAAIGGSHIFNRKLFHSLGYLNVERRDGTPIFGPPWDPTNPDPNNPVQGANVYTGLSRQAFPWLTWWNRPPVSPLELLLVPTVRSSRLLCRREDNPDALPPQPEAFYHYYRIVDRDVTVAGVSDAERLNPFEPYQGADRAPWAVPYPHLANFFESARTWESPQHGRRPAPELHRILEFVRVPSPFVGVELQANPAAMSGNPPTGPAHGFHPPNHLISEYREPGRINLNTLVSELVWQGLWNSPALGLPRNDPDNPDDPNPLRIQFGVDVASGFDRYVGRDSAGTPQVLIASLWQRWIQSRRGYGASDNVLEMDPFWPTRFANPLRSWMGAYLFPLDTFQDVVPREVDATLLREHPLDISWQNRNPMNPSQGNPNPIRPRRPLFETESVGDPSVTDPTNPLSRPLPWCDTDRNPFFRYRNLIRLANLVTCRSNVYAVWITVGFFEVTPVRSDTVPPAVQAMLTSPDDLRLFYPDGWIIGPELGSDTGQIKRHRMFFIVDRTIPVGFERGRNHNVDKAILVKRFIE